MLESNLYIACLNLKGRRALVVGAGSVGLEKINGLLVCGASVSVVAPDVHKEVDELSDLGAIELNRRAYRTSDLDGCFVVVAATSDTDLNTRIYADAEARSMLVNVVDVPDLCNFILPAISREGPLAVAISTSGASPALAKRMKREAGEMFGPEYAELAFLLDEQREWAKSVLPTYQDRKEFFEAIVNGEPDPIEMLREKQVLAVRELIAAAKRRVQE
ncbi:MAG: precorrin-2 dehydrogenase/sirohydrochlorin ferrochelatase family protein [Actinomycetota bacterium]